MSLIDQPSATNRRASQSRSAGCVGVSPRRPKSLLSLKIWAAAESGAPFTRKCRAFVPPRSSTVPGTQQLYVLPARGGALEQLTDFPDAVSGLFLPDGRVLVEMDDGGNERTQLYTLEGARLPLVVE